MKILLLALLLASTAIAQTMQERIAQYQTVRLTTDLSTLSPTDKQILRLLLQAAQLMDDAYKQQRHPTYDRLRVKLPEDATRRYFDINYGPYDQLDGNKPFVEGVSPKPEGLYFYPEDMTKAEFEALKNPLKNNPYTVIVRGKDGKLYTVWYHEKWAVLHTKAAELLEQAAGMTTDAGFKNYLTLRAKALRTDDYYASDAAWLDMKTNRLDIVIGPIESYDDELFGIRTSYEAFVLVKDMEWSQRLARFATLLPELQRGLPVPDAYKTETPGTEGDLNAYDAVFYAGDCNGGPKTIAINLPNDEKLQLEKGTRRLQLKNTMRAKFDHILVPIANQLLDPAQRKHILFNAFFSNVMFHEVAHGLGIKNTINGKGYVKDALKENHSAIEEAKADVLGLYMVSQLYKGGHLTEGTIEDCYVTFVAGIFRSTRFGAASAHAKANLLAMDHFLQMGAVTLTPEGYYHVNLDKMPAAVESLAAKILRVQGDGDYAGAKAWLADKAVPTEAYQKQMQKLAGAKIPIDIIFEQGAKVLGLE